MKKVLTIAGSDCSGGAGIQADLKTMATNGVYGMSVITALTAQNTTGVSGVMEVSGDFVKKQIDMVFTDIYPDAIKIGMVSSADLIDVIAERLNFYGAKNIVVDPVIVATSGSKLINDDAIDILKSRLFKIADVITPNIYEGSILANMEIKNKEDMEKAIIKINNEFECSVLLKGGHSVNDANDLLCENGKLTWFEAERIENFNTHGTGCTLSSAIASNLAKGNELYSSIKMAKSYISSALEYGLDLGKGSGPLNHSFMIK